MNEDQVQGNGVAAGSTPTPTPQQPQPMPSSEPQVPNSPVQDEFALPENVSDRTREQFEKLRTKNAELAAQLEASKSKPTPTQPTETYDSVFDFLKPQGGKQGGQPMVSQNEFQFLDRGQINNIGQRFVDTDGNVDIEGLNQALSNANISAQQAFERARQAEDRVARYEETQQLREAYAVYPQLDPTNKDFDPNLFELARDRVLRNMYEGRNESLLQVAQRLTKSYVSPNQPKPVPQEVIEARNQGPVESGKGQPRETSSDYQNLRERTRAGDDTALAERLKALGI